MVDTSEPTRTVETAIVESPNSGGPPEYYCTVSVRELLGMSSGDWGYLRDMAADHRQDPKKGLRITCLQCGEALFVRAQRHGDRNLPLFSHYAGAETPCPWNRGQTLSPDQVRAMQYGGRHESKLHARLCRILEGAARSDPRYVCSTVDAYRKPETQEHGRYPDVYVIWKHRAPTVFEVQLSKTQQPEIAGREDHYGKEECHLIWVLYGTDPRIDELPQAFDDIARRHRDNLFLIDQASMEASKNRGTIVLTCFLKGLDGKFEEPRLVALDDLTYPANGLPFFEDRISGALLARSQAARILWLRALKVLPEDWRKEWRIPDELKPEVAALKAKHGFLSDFDASEETDFVVTVLVAFCLTITAHAARPDRVQNYVTRHKDISAAINALMQHPGVGMQRYAPIIEHLVSHTAIGPRLPMSVWTHLKRAKEATMGNLCLEHEPEWAILRDLIPEVFDWMLRERLIQLNSLPNWASSYRKDVASEDPDVI